ncbi:MAG: OsmC family protein [Geminicoccaceae bacterium]|nr:OsmC family protein [Geminicoccaceae bacterium]MCB9942135.1 OsmC family protein [Geminicoccaceae bacterium]
MSDDLKRIISETGAAFRADASAAQAVFSSSSQLQEGLRSQVSIRQHGLVVDEPPALGGTDAGPNPVELILAALGTCQEITYRAFAAALGIPLAGVSVKLDGDIDLRGFFAVDDSIRPGYQKITGTVTLVSDAPVEKLEMLKEAVDGHCPVLDMLRNPTPVALSARFQQPAGTAA